MTWKMGYCTICKTNHRLNKIKNGWHCALKDHKQRSGKFIVYWQNPNYANSQVNNKVGKNKKVAGLKQTELKSKKTTSPISKRENINAESKLSVPANSSQPNPDKSLNGYEEYLKAITPKSPGRKYFKGLKNCLLCNKTIETTRGKHAKYCKACAAKRTAKQMKDSMKAYSAKNRAKTQRKKWLKNQLKKLNQKKVKKCK